MKSRLVTTSLMAASLLGVALLIGCNAESTATNISPTATTVSFHVTEMT